MINLEIPDEIIGEVIHLLRYAMCDEPTSNEAWVTLNKICDKYGEKITDKELLMYSINNRFKNK